LILTFVCYQALKKGTRTKVIKCIPVIIPLSISYY